MGVIIVSIFTLIDQAKVEFLIHSAGNFGALNRISWYPRCLNTFISRINVSLLASLFLNPLISMLCPKQELLKLTKPHFKFPILILT